MEETSLLPPQPVLNQNPKYVALYKIIIVFLLVLIAYAAGYYFSFNESEQSKQSFVLPQKIAPLKVSQVQIDKKFQVLNPTVQVQKAADHWQTEQGKKDASQPVAEPASLPASQTAVSSAHKEGTSSHAIRENNPTKPAPAVNTTMYYVNMASFKLKENADVAIKNLQKKGYEPEGDTITVKDTTWYRVTLGHFQTQGEAQNYARELQIKENINGFVVKKK